MIVLDPPLVLALSMLVGALASLVWAFRRSRSGR